MADQRRGVFLRIGKLRGYKSGGFNFSQSRFIRYHLLRKKCGRYEAGAKTDG